jgi:hypothetical protein
MSFFIERDRFGESISMHLQHVYEHLFPGCKWKDLALFGFGSVLVSLPPDGPSSRIIGERYHKYLLSDRLKPFIYLDTFKVKPDRLMLGKVLADITLNDDFGKKIPVNNLDVALKETDRFGGMAKQIVGYERKRSLLYPEPQCVTPFCVVKLNVLGILNSGRPRGLLYFGGQNIEDGRSFISIPQNHGTYR